MPWVNGHYVAEVVGDYQQPAEQVNPPGHIAPNANRILDQIRQAQPPMEAPQAGLYGGGIAAQYEPMDVPPEAPRAGRLRDMVADYAGYAGKTTPGSVSKEYNSMSRSNFSYINQMEWRMWAVEQARRAAASGQLGKHDLTDVITQARLIESYLYSDPRTK